MRFFSIFTLMLLISVEGVNCKERTVLMEMDEHTQVANRCAKLQTDANLFRAYGTGAARHQNTAKIKAQMDANSKLSNTARIWIKEFLSKYLTETGHTPERYMQTFEGRGWGIIEEKIFNDATIACDGVDGIDDDGLYNVYLTLEIKRKNVFEALIAALSIDKDWKDVYDRPRLDAFFKTEIGKLKKRKK